MRRLNERLQRCQKLGNLVGGQPLANEGKVISGEKQRTIADGPFAESKEAVGGYVLTRAADFDKATQIASEWPLLDYGASVEVRMVMEKCATMQLVAAEEERMEGCANEGA